MEAQPLSWLFFFHYALLLSLQSNKLLGFFDIIGTKQSPTTNCKRLHILALLMEIHFHLKRKKKKDEVVELSSYNNWVVLDHPHPP